MKRIFFITLLTIGASYLTAQSNKVDQLQALEQNQQANQDIVATATLKSASRLFATKDDLTSVIVIIPADSVVSVLDSDSTYFHVVFNENEGYIFKKDAILDKTPVNDQQTVQVQPPAVQQNEQVREQQQQSRYSYLENKYGPELAPRLLAGKIWKGMNSDMVRDSWGNADRKNRMVSGNIIKEEWIYRNTWLYFENGALMEWGPVKK
jgi:hypothetical protein